MKSSSLVILGFMICLSSCGIRWFSKSTGRLNTSLPPAITEFTYLHGDFTSSVDPTLVIGTLLIQTNDSTFLQTERQYFNNDSLIVLREFSEDPIYLSKITHGFEANGKYVVAELTADGEIAYELAIPSCEPIS